MTVTDHGQFYRYQDGELRIITENCGDVTLAIADSFLVADGRVRGLNRHFDRFEGWVRQIAPQHLDLLPGFFEAVKAALPREGRWFPRIEWHGEAPDAQNLYLRLREAPEPQPIMTLWTADEVDPRVNPRVKGPDLSLGMQLRRKAIVHGADEAVLLTKDGFIAEGALSAIVWWRGDVLCAPVDEIPWLPSITRQEVFEIANQMGIQTKLERAKPGDLVGLEIWGLSSLQGIRAVVDWVNLGAPVGKATHAESFQKRMRLLEQQID